MKAYTIIIPCFNEENAILKTFTSIIDTTDEIDNFQIIIVNDGSYDNTKIILEQLEKKHENVLIINHEKNKGYGAALKTGLRRANHKMIVITDADGTYPNERIPELVEYAINENMDMVVGSRTAKGEVEYPLIRKIPKWFLLKYASWMAGQKIPDMNSGLRVFKKEIAEKFISILPNGFSFTTTITLAMLTNYYSVKYIPISYSSRIGKSKIKPIRDTINFIQLILRTGMYFAPLRVFLPITFILSVAFGISFVYDTFQGNLTDKTLIFLMFTLNSGMFALLADMIDKRN